jgi:uncharacterized protein (AIM24 family)
MKLKLQLQPGSIGIGFDGRPVVVRKVVESSPYHDYVQPHKMIVSGVSIPGVVTIQGVDLDSLFLIALLKEFHDTPGRTLSLEERPFLDQKRVRSQRRSTSEKTSPPSVPVTPVPSDLSGGADDDKKYMDAVTEEKKEEIKEMVAAPPLQEVSLVDDGDDDDDDAAVERNESQESFHEIEEEEDKEETQPKEEEEVVTAVPVSKEDMKKTAKIVPLDSLTTTQEPTKWTVYLPAGRVGIEFKNVANLGPSVVSSVDPESPLASVIVPGLQFHALEIPGVAVFEDIHHAGRIMTLLDAHEDVADRVLHLFMPLNEVAGCNKMLTSLTEGKEFEKAPVRYVPLAGNSLCKIEGNESQMATIRLCSGQTIQSASESLVYMSSNVLEELSRGRNDSFKRISTDERIALSVFTVPPKTDLDGEPQKNGTAHGTVVMAPSYPARIFVVDLESFGGAIIAGSRNFLFTNDERVMVFSYTAHQSPSSPSTSPTNAAKSNSPAALLLRGEGSIRMHRIMGKGKVFLTAGGIVVQKDLKRGETIRVSTQKLAAYQFGMSVVMEGVKGLGNVVVWEQGTTVLTGPGTVWIESQPARRHRLLEKR